MSKEPDHTPDLFEPPASRAESEDPAVSGRGGWTRNPCKSIGQGVVAFVLRELLRLTSLPIDCLTEKIPPELRKVEIDGFQFPYLLLDVWVTAAQLREHPDLQSVHGLEILAEVHGDQHYDRNHHFNEARNRAKKTGDSFDRLQGSIKAKRRYAAADPDHRKLLEIPYPYSDREDLRRLVNRTIKELEAQVPQVQRVPDYASAKSRVLSPAWLQACLTSRFEERVRATHSYLANTDRPNLRFAGYNVIEDTVQLFCAAHSPMLPLNPIRWNNLKTGNFGCQACQYAAQGDLLRLPQDELLARAAALGFKPGFPLKDYEYNNQSLPWVCLAVGHVAPQRFSRLDQGCSVCRQHNRDIVDQASLRAKVLQQLADNDEELESPVEGVNRFVSKVKVRCYSCRALSERPVAKIISPSTQQRCKCHQHEGAVRSKQARALEKLPQVLERMGLQVLSRTPAPSGKHREAVLWLQPKVGEPYSRRVSALQQQPDYLAARAELFGVRPRKPRKPKVQ